ncbi:unnamed protein product [Brassica rapa]|uniref:Uncharacterized protein n=1 Tax=Brassica campestris TaxID=3711 RepID=A0A8D9HN20_BRACM|nr:unnamed protein product [Brassica rapa]
MQPTVDATGKNPPRVGYVGHITRLWNKLISLGGDSNALTKSSLQENSERKEWQSSVLQDRNTVENCVQMGLRVQPLNFVDLHLSRGNNNGLAMYKKRRICRLLLVVPIEKENLFCRDCGVFGVIIAVILNCCRWRLLNEQA